jgi:hypothetical protein
VALQKVSYALEDGTVAEFEFEPGDDWHQVASGVVIAKVKDAVRPAVESAKVVLDEVNRLAPGDVAVKFGIKVTGSANWLVAKASSEASFEVTLTWHPGQSQKASAPGDDGEDSAKP